MMPWEVVEDTEVAEQGDAEYADEKERHPSDAAQDVATFAIDQQEGIIMPTIGSAPDGDPPRYPEGESSLVAYEPPAESQHHIVTGMAMIARMSAEDYEATIETIVRGLERVKDFQQRAMTKGQDYGVVKGIDRPFLHLPGAEKLCLLYGLAARQEAERIIGERKPGATEEDEKYGKQWISPPLAYHVKTYIHLGNFDGPIVAMGYGEASSWEEKYRYRWGKATCPNCGREGMIRGRADGKLKGKWWCPGKENGCNRTYEPNDPSIESPGKVENTDPYSLAETLLQMAAKRSFVAATRRATGTSGLFTQDEDSPSVREQAGGVIDDDAGADATPVQKVEGVKVEAGAKQAGISAPQTAEIVALSKENDLGPSGLSALLKRLFDLTVAETGKAVSDSVKALTADQAAQLIQTIKTGEVPAQEATPGFPPASSEDM